MELPTPQRQLATTETQGSTAIGPERDAADVSIAAEGVFRPGGVIAITATVHPQVDIGSGTLELMSLDAKPSVADVNDYVPPVIWAKPVSGARGTPLMQRANMVFADPGYYRVAARLVVQPDDGNRTLVRLAIAELWLFVHPAGGRTTAVHDPSLSADSSYRFAYGSSGRMEPRPKLVKEVMNRAAGPTLPGASLVGKALTAVGGMIGRAFGLSGGRAQVGTWMQGNVYYIDYSAGGNGVKRPVRGGIVDAVCYGKSQPWIIVFDLATPVLAGVNQSGYFSVTCPDERYSVVDGST
jgi:hypothetical protein